MWFCKELAVQSLFWQSPWQRRSSKNLCQPGKDRVHKNSVYILVYFLFPEHIIEIKVTLREKVKFSKMVLF